MTDGGPTLAGTAAIGTEFLFDLKLILASAAKPAYDIGSTPAGHRITGGIAGGSFAGPRLRGSVAPTGGDYAVLRPDDVLVPDARAVLQTDDGALIYVSYHGLIHPWSRLQAARQGGQSDPAAVDWKVCMRFETAIEQYDWMNRTLAVARGSLHDNGFRYQVFALV